MDTPELPDFLPFTQATLYSPTLLTLLGNLNEFELRVDDAGKAVLRGDGYRHEIQGVFSRLVFDWEAEAHLEYNLGLPAGTYHLSYGADAVILHAGELTQPLPEGAVTVYLVSVVDGE